MLAWGGIGCESATDVGRPAIQPASARTRAARRAYEGAPPVIPHPPLTGSCINCHTTTGSELPGLGLAPANPHTRTPGLSADSRCRQCHVFRLSTDQFRPTDFTGFHVVDLHGERASPKAPPRIPHARFMREDCQACHAGVAARPELICRHTERRNCGQCHVSQAARSPDGSTTKD